MPPDEAFVPAVSTPPPSDTWPAWIVSVPPERLVPTAPLRSIAGEIATPPVAVIESERPVVQSLPFPPGMKQVCSCASGPMKTSVALMAVSPARRTLPSRYSRP